MTAHPTAIQCEARECADNPRGNGMEIAFYASPVPQMILETGKLCIVEANPASAEALGLPLGELIGAEFHHFLPSAAAIDSFMRRLPVFDDGNQPALGRVAPQELRRADGSVFCENLFCASCRQAGGYPGFLIQLHPGTGFRGDKLDDTLAKMVDTSQHLIECIGDGFIVLNEAGLVTYANASASRILGRPRRNLRDRRFREIFPQLSEEDLARAVQTCTSDSNTHPMRIPIFFGCELHHFEFNIRPYRDGLGILFRDISEHVKQEMEIAKLNATMKVSQELLRSKNEELNASLEELARLNEQLANADKLKSDFLANTSHELRTPLNSIIGFLQLINEGLCESREEELEYVSNALASGNHLLSLINDVLDIAKIEAGKMQLLIDDIDMDVVFHEVFSMTHIQAQQKHLALTFEIRDERRRIARADFHKVKQVLINLVGNAIKFTAEGFIKVWCEPDPQRPDLLRVSVQDSGIGVPPYMQQSIFEKFTQVDGTSTRKYQGTGLGLAISRNLVELMGGSIGIFSEGEMRGTTMFFSLPASGLMVNPEPCTDGGAGAPEELPGSF